MVALAVFPAKNPLSGSVPIAADSGIVERWALLASLALGKSRIMWSGVESGFAELLQRLGIEVTAGSATEASGKISRHLEVHGRGLWGFTGSGATPIEGDVLAEPHGFLGTLAAQRFPSQLSVASRATTELVTLAESLNARGARIEISELRAEEKHRIVIQGLNPDQRLDGLERVLPFRQASLKGGLFFSGLFARGPTTLHETWVSPDHCERLFNAVGLPVAALGPTVSLHPPASGNAIESFSATAPGDASLATAICLAALMIPESRVTVRDVNLNFTRLGLLDFLRQLGAKVGYEVNGEVLGEPFGQITVGFDSLRSGMLDLEFVSRVGVELPLACVALSRANGRSSVAEFSKICSRSAEVVELLRAFGIIAEMHGDTLEVEGRGNALLEPACIDSNGDPWRAISATLLGLASDGETLIQDADCIALEFPRFVGTLRSLGASIEVRT